MAPLKRTYSGLKLPASETPTARPSAPRRGRANGWLIGALIILLAATGFMGYQLYQLKSQPNLLGQKELEQVVKKVGKLVVLPEGETPTLATVTDPEKLKDQPFFANAQVGFKVLLYAQAKKAILYDPKTNRVVEIAPINPTAAPEGTTQTPSTTTPSTTTP